MKVVPSFLFTVFFFLCPEIVGTNNRVESIFVMLFFFFFVKFSNVVIRREKYKKCPDYIVPNGLSSSSGHFFSSIFHRN